MLNKFNHKRGGFTLVEIMIVVAIIALLAAIAVPNFLRARKRSQATVLLENYRLLDSALDQYAIDNNKTGGDPVTYAQLSQYIKRGTTLYDSLTGVGVASAGDDPYTKAYAGGESNVKVDTIMGITEGEFDLFSDVTDTAFWSPYINTANP